MRIASATRLMTLGAWALGGAAWVMVGASCATTPPPPPVEDEVAEEDDVPPGMVRLVEYEEKTQQLLEASQRLEELETNVDDQRRRLARVCADYPEHIVCDVHKAAAFARDAFCTDSNFTEHVDEVVKACHQGACKQVDEAQLLSRTQYMTLLQRLPHKLLTFKSADTRLDANDQRELQQFLEAIRSEGGYIIIVGRASREGPWRDNLRYALDRAENTRAYLVEQLGFDAERVGYITYGHEKMYLTPLDAERLTTRKLNAREANRSALVFSYPCYSK